MGPQNQQTIVKLLSSDPPKVSVGFKTSTVSDVAYENKVQISYLISARVANVSGADATVTAKWYNSKNATDYTLANAIKVPVNSYLTINLDDLTTLTGDKLKITGSANNAFHCIVTVKELSSRNTG
jgi:hypothetical protein